MYVLKPYRGVALTQHDFKKKKIELTRGYYRIVRYFGSIICAFKMVNPSIRDTIMSSINSYYDNVKRPVPDGDLMHRNAHDMVLRAVSKIDALDHDANVKLSGLASRIDDMEGDVAFTKARLDSHIEASDHRHALAEARFRVNKIKIAEVASVVADLRAESNDCQELTDAKIFDVMLHVDEVANALKASSNVFKRDLDDVAARANGFEERIGALETRFGKILCALDSLAKGQLSVRE